MSILSVVVAAGVFTIALVWLVVGIAGLRGALPRNRWVGVRTEETLASEETFRVANQVAAPGTIGASVILIAGGLLTLGVGGGWSLLFGLGALLAALAIVGVVSGYGVRAALLVPVEEHSCGCCSGSAPTQSDAAGSHATDANETASAASQAAAAADCGESSCASCTLRGVCSSDVSTHSAQA